MTLKKAILTIKIALNVILIVIMFIPYGRVFFPENKCIDDTCWVKIAIIDDFELTWTYILFIIAYTFYFWGRKLTWLKVIIIVLDLLLLQNAIFSMMIATQDFMPLSSLMFISFFHCGVLLILAFDGSISKLTK